MRVIAGTFILALFVGASAAKAPRKVATEPKHPATVSKETPSSIGGKGLDDWKKALSSEDASKRAEAILAIVQFGEAASSCVPAIVDRLRDHDVSPRARALLALRTMSIEDKDLDRVVRAVAGRIAPLDRMTAPETQAIIRYEATLTLNRFITDGQPAIPALIIGTMDRASWEIRHNAVSLLWRIGYATGKEGSPPDTRITEALLAALRFEKTFQVKMEILQGLGAMGRPATQLLQAKVVSELSLCAVHPNRPLAIWAYCGLVAMQDGKPAELALMTLAKFLKNDKLETRVQAAAALGALREKATKKVPALLEMLKDREPYAVQAAATALGAIGDKSDAVTDALMKLLDDKDVGNAAHGVMALVNLKKNTSAVRAKFEEMVKDLKRERALRNLVEDAMKELQKPAAKKG